MVDPVSARLHDDALVIDGHTHGLGFVPPPFGALYRLVNGTTMPADQGFEVLPDAGVNAAVVKAVGDPAVTRWYRGGPWRAVHVQLGRFGTQVEASGGRVVRTVGELRAARDDGASAAILGLEGADPLNGDVDRVDELHQRGVRVVGIIHMADNELGTTCMPWQRYVGPLPTRRRAELGLTAFGRRVVERMNRLGMVIDLAHADTPTLLDVVAMSRQPVISSHTGAHHCSAFPRFLTDEEIDAIAATGGVMGLWPYNHRGKGVPDVATLMAHARHIADRVGARHLSIGTDMNGVPGLMDGYRGEHDLPVITDALLAHGFDEKDVRGILGENLGRVLEEVCA